LDFAGEPPAPDIDHRPATAARRPRVYQLQCRHRLGGHAADPAADASTRRGGSAPDRSVGPRYLPDTRPAQDGWRGIFHGTSHGGGTDHADEGPGPEVSGA